MEFVILLSGGQVRTANLYSSDPAAVLKAKRPKGTPVCQQQLLIDDCTL